MTIAGIGGLPTQAASCSDKKAAKSLYRLVEKLLKKHPDLQVIAQGLLAENPIEDAGLSTFSFLICPDSIVSDDFDLDRIGQGKQTMFSLDISFLQQTFSSTTELCCFLVSREHSAFVEAVKAKGARTADELEKKCQNVELILSRLEKRAESGQKALDGVVSLDFWQAEYAKRRFLRDQEENAELRGMARGIFGLLRSLYKKLVPVRPPHCVDCAWATGTTSNDAQPLFFWLGCNGRECEFTKQVQRLASLESKEAAGELNTDQMPISTHSGWQDCLSIYSHYGLLPYELYSFTVVQEVFAYRATNGQFPKRMIVHPPSSVEFSQSSWSVFKSIEDVWEGRKKGFCGYKYHELDEDRLIGLWLWDTALQKGCLDKPSSSVFQMILDEPWFRCTHVWKEACGKSEVAQQGRKGSWEDNLHAEALARTIQALQSDLRFTKDSIRHNQILPKCSYKGK